jgi:O-antigen/teichoic acid export membrane protein
MQGSVLVSSIIVARLLGLVSFGGYALIISTVMTVAAMAQGGTSLVATKLVGESLQSGPASVGRLLRVFRNFAFTMGVLAAILLFGLSELLADEVFARPELVQPLRLIALAGFFLVFVSYQIGALQGFGAFREMSFAGVAAGAFHVALTSLGAFLGGVNGAILGFVVSSALRAVLLGRALDEVRRAHDVPKSVVVARSDFHPIWRLAVPAGLAGIVTLPSLWLVTVLVSRLPDGLALVAIFAVAHQLRLAVLQLPSLLNAVSFSALSRAKGRNETSHFRSIFWSNLTVNIGFSAVVVIVMISLSEPLLRLYGPEFGDGRWLLIILLVSVIPESLAMSTYQLIQSAGRMWYSLFAIVIPRDLIYVTVSVVVIAELGLLGAGIAYLIAWIAALSLVFLSVRKRFYG